MVSPQTLMPLLLLFSQWNQWCSWFIPILRNWYGIHCWIRHLKCLMGRAFPLVFKNFTNKNHPLQKWLYLVHLILPTFLWATNGCSLVSFKEVLFIFHLKVFERERNRESDLTSSVSLSKFPQHLEMHQSKVGAGSSSKSPYGYRGPKTWSILHVFTVH